MLIALDDDRDKIEGLETGADDYVTKPFHPEEPVARVRAVLQSRNAESPLATPSIHRLPGDTWIELEFRKLKSCGCGHDGPSSSAIALGAIFAETGARAQRGCRQRRVPRRRVKTKEQSRAKRRGIDLNHCDLPAMQPGDGIRGRSQSIGSEWARSVEPVGLFQSDLRICRGIRRDQPTTHRRVVSALLSAARA
jgi:hypothetical protein